MNDVTREQLTGDLRQVLDDVQTLLAQAGQASGQQAQELRSRAAEQLQRAQARLGELQHRVSERSRAAVHATDDWVHMHPWSAVGLGAGVGFLVGLLVARH
jgi:ElaB/YqjD/DUF883 family membrane-anchored ribosome-binding protein